MNEQGELFGVYDYQDVERAKGDMSHLVAHEMTVEEYQHHVNKHKQKIEDEIYSDKSLKQGITFLDYKFIRRDNYLIFDDELKLENLRMQEGDVLDVKVSDTGKVFFAIRKLNHAL